MNRSNVQHSAAVMSRHVSAAIFYDSLGKIKVGDESRLSFGIYLDIYIWRGCSLKSCAQRMLVTALRGCGIDFDEAV